MGWRGGGGGGGGGWGLWSHCPHMIHRPHPAEMLLVSWTLVLGPVVIYEFEFRVRRVPSIAVVLCAVSTRTLEGLKGESICDFLGLQGFRVHQPLASQSRELGGGRSLNRAVRAEWFSPHTNLKGDRVWGLPCWFLFMKKTSRYLKPY